MVDFFSFLMFFGSGIYAIVGAAQDAEWFMGEPKTQVFVRLLGRMGARVFYVLLGIGLIFLGFFEVFDF